VNDAIRNDGIMNTGNGTVQIGTAAVGKNAHITNTYPAPQSPRTTPRGIGVVTIKANEMRAVIDEFGLAKENGTPSGQNFYTGTVDSVDVVAVRALEQGQRSMMAALGHLRQHVNPAMFVVLGVGGAINRGLVIGDVVVANRVIYYDLRRETPDGVRNRGEERHAPPAITHAVNSFFTDHGEPAHLETISSQKFRVWPGPIGSGDALVMDAESWIRKFLLAYSEYTLAVDMEAAGLTQFCHEAPSPRPGWLVVRGISDLADAAKTEAHQPSAARNAAIALRHLVPYLPVKV
jgi:adenosylhomocysteine nucleosidase